MFFFISPAVSRDRVAVPDLLRPRGLRVRPPRVPPRRLLRVQDVRRPPPLRGRLPQPGPQRQGPRAQPRRGGSRGGEGAPEHQGGALLAGEREREYRACH